MQQYNSTNTKSHTPQRTENVQNAPLPTAAQSYSNDLPQYNPTQSNSNNSTQYSTNQRLQQPSLNQYQPQQRQVSNEPVFQQTAPPQRNRVVNNTATIAQQVQPNNRFAANQNQAVNQPRQNPVNQAVQNQAQNRTVNRQVNFVQDELPSDGGQQNLPPIKKELSVPKERISGSVQLRNVKPVDFQRKLVDRLGERRVQVKNLPSKENRSVMQMSTADGSLFEVNIDLYSGLIQMTGSKASVAGFSQIVKLLDTRDNPNTQTDLAPYSRIHYRTVQQVIDAIEQNQGPIIYDENDEDFPTFNQNQPQPGATFVQPDGSFVQGQGPNRNQPGIGIAPSVGTGNGTSAIDQVRQSGLLGQVQIEVIEGMEAVVIRGPKEDVARVRELIRQIEEAGAEQEPQVVIHPMQHTDCTRVGTLVRLLYNEVYGSRRGSINITPLVKPNSLLLVGKKESIETVIELVNKLDVPVDPRHEFKYIRLRNVSPTDVKTMLDEFYASREQMGPYVTVTADTRMNAIIIYANPRDMKEVERMVGEMDAAESAAVSSIQVFTLLNSNATQVATTLQNAFSGTTTGTGGFGGTANRGTAKTTMLELKVFDANINEVMKSGVVNAADVTITANTSNNSLLVKAPKDCMDLIAAIIKQIDQLPVAESQIKVFKIVNGDANNLYTMLQTLFQTSTTGTTGSNTLTTRPGFEEGESSMIPVRFSVDVRSNSIIALGSAGDLNVVEAVLFKLDEDETQERNLYVFRLLHSRADVVSTAVNSYLSSERSVEQVDNELFSVKEQYRREVVVVEETLTNSLIVSCAPRFYPMISKLIRHLDTRPPMVVIQVLIAEVTLNNMREFGVEFGLQDSILFDRSVGGVPGFNFNNQPLGNNVEAPNPDNVGTQGLTNLGVGRTGSGGYGGFVFSASSESVSVLIRALEERQKVDVLSRPEITAMHNQRATIQVGQEVPYSNSVITNDTVVNSTEFIPVGIILDVTPRISDDGIISLYLYAEKSSAAESTGGLAPRVTVQKLQTTINAIEGQTVLIGGLISNDTTRTTRAVPFVSRIPVVGRLFEYNLNKCERREMIVIMTPTIIRCEEDMEKVKMQELQRIHWCIDDVKTLIDARTLRKRGEYYNPSETRVVAYDGYVPEEDELPSWKRVTEISPGVVGNQQYDFEDQVPVSPDQPLHMYNEQNNPTVAPPEPMMQRQYPQPTLQ